MLNLVSNSLEGTPLLPTASYIAATLKTRLILLFSGLADSWVTLTVGRDLGTHQPVTPRNSSYRELLCWVFYIHFIVYLFSMVHKTRLNFVNQFSVHYPAGGLCLQRMRHISCQPHRKPLGEAPCFIIPDPDQILVSKPHTRKDN